MHVSADGRADSPADNRADDQADGRWMSLKELAVSRRISVASAARLMRRRHWRRQPGNDGHIRVWVPAGEDEPAAEARPDIRADSRPDVSADLRPDALADIRSGIEEVVRPLQDAIAVLETQLAEANARAARAEQTVADERIRADSRADILRDKIEALQDELRQAQDAARISTDALKAVRQAAEARKARGRWARLRAAWRGK